MRIYVQYGDRKLELLGYPETKCGEVREFLRKKFDIRLSNEGTIPIDLLYEGATLYDAWTLNGIGMMSGETIKAIEKSSQTIVLSVYSAFNNKVYQIYDKIDFTTTPIYVLRRIVSQLSGLPVSIFRLVTRSNLELFDKFTLSRYHEVGPGGVVRLDIWNGWSNLLNCAINGEMRRFTNCLSKVEKLAQFQARVGLYIAAHRGHSQLSERLTTKKSPTAVSPGDGVGVHPARLWCDTSHPDTNKAPVHVAAECGHLHILRIFFSNDVTCITAGDSTPSDAKAWNYALRYKQKECARYLLAKCFAKVPVGKTSGDQGQISITIAIKMRQWLHRAKRRLQERQRYKKGVAGVISKSLSELSMSGIAVAIDGPNGVSKMVSDQRDNIRYLSVDDMNRRSHRGNTKRKPSYQKPKIRRYTTRSSSSAILDTKQPSKTTFNPEVEVFGTKLGHYGVRGVPSEPKIIPDVLPIERSYDTIKKVSLPSSREPVPTFMFLDSYQRILDSVHLGLDDDEGGPDNSRDSAVNFVSASARFTKKPFLKQLDLAKRMAREKANRALGLKNTSVPNLSDLSQGQLI